MIALIFFVCSVRFFLSASGSKSIGRPRSSDNALAAMRRFSTSSRPNKMNQISGDLVALARVVRRADPLDIGEHVLDVRDHQSVVVTGRLDLVGVRLLHVLLPLDEARPPSLSSGPAYVTAAQDRLASTGKNGARL